MRLVYLILLSLSMITPLIGEDFKRQIDISETVKIPIQDKSLVFSSPVDMALLRQENGELIVTPYKKGDLFLLIKDQEDQSSLLYQFSIVDYTVEKNPFILDQRLIHFDQKQFVKASKEALDQSKSYQKRFDTQELLQNRQVPWQSIIQILICLFIAFVAYRYYKRFQKQPKKTITISAKDKALQALQALNWKELVDNGNYDLFYSKITWIVRLFIEEEFEIKAPERTTQEFLQEAKNFSGFNPEMKKKLESFLSNADLVKFAKYEPSFEDCEMTKKRALEFIEQL